jgi:hypothetical protein
VATAYTNEFKSELVNRAKEASIGSVARRFGVPESTIRGWIKADRLQSAIGPVDSDTSAASNPTSVATIEFACRDNGHGIETGTIVGRWNGQIDGWGKLSIETRDGFHYLFKDEIMSVSLPPISGGSPESSDDDAPTTFGKLGIGDPFEFKLKLEWPGEFSLASGPWVKLSPRKYADCSRPSVAHRVGGILAPVVRQSVEFDSVLISEATQSLFASSYADAIENAGGRFPSGARIEEYTPDHPETAETVVRGWIAQVESAWRFPIPVVFAAMGLDDSDDLSSALYYLVMGCVGHGVGLWDDHSDSLDDASRILGVKLDAAPVNLDSCDMDIIAEDYIATNGMGNLSS